VVSCGISMAYSMPSASARCGRMHSSCLPRTRV
jgi:hypothetical protein